MALYTYNGLLLRAPNGMLANDSSCCCGSGSGSGSGGSGSGSGESTVDVCCCPDNLMSANLILEFTGCTGAAACLNGLTYPLAWDGVDRWTNTTAVGCSSNGFSAMEFVCNVSGDPPPCNWSVNLAGCVDILTAPDSVTCDPFLASGSDVVVGGTCVNLGDTVGWNIYSA